MFFTSILNFFKKFFGKDSDTVQKVVTGVNELFQGSTNPSLPLSLWSSPLPI
jgi:hypothetical protein